MLTSPDATASPGMKSSGNMFFKYQLNDLQFNLFRSSFRADTSPYSPYIHRCTMHDTPTQTTKQYTLPTMVLWQTVTCNEHVKCATVWSLHAITASPPTQTLYREKYSATDCHLIMTHFYVHRMNLEGIMLRVFLYSKLCHQNTHKFI